MAVTPEDDADRAQHCEPIVGVGRSITIEGLKELQRRLEQASRAFENINGEIATIQFDANDQTSIETAIATMKQAIDYRVEEFADNPIVASVAAQLKAKFEEEILNRAMEAKVNPVGSTENSGRNEKSERIDEGLFRQIENTVLDLRRADHGSFDRHIQKLSRLLHAPGLDQVSQALVQDVDLDAWLKAGAATAGSMAGSARLPWPSDLKQELGLVIELIDRFAAAGADEAFQFSFDFYYAGNDITNTLQNMVAQMIVPFARDYIDYVKAVTGASEPTLLPEKTGPAPRKAFVVHGHHEGIRESVARFLEQLGFEAIILHEQANQGRTVIEKIEAHGDVGFAVVLLSPDDEGNTKGETPQPRARQNVILELGYFIGRLGRSRVCALKQGEIEIPSDFAGVVYEPFDNGNGWKAALGRELEAAGFDIDWNRIFKHR